MYVACALTEFAMRAAIAPGIRPDVKVSQPQKGSKAQAEEPKPRGNTRTANRKTLEKLTCGLLAKLGNPTGPPADTPDFQLPATVYALCKVRPKANENQHWLSNIDKAMGNCTCPSSHGLHLSAQSKRCQPSPRFFF